MYAFPFNSIQKQNCTTILVLIQTFFYVQSVIYKFYIILQWQLADWLYQWEIMITFYCTRPISFYSKTLFNCKSLLIVRPNIYFCWSTEMLKACVHTICMFTKNLKPASKHFIFQFHLEQTLEFVPVGLL